MNFSDTFKSVAHGIPAILTGGKPGYRAGEDKLAWANANFATSAELSLKSERFDGGSPIPASYSADSGTLSPPISWHGIPGQTKSIVLIVEDPDAPTPNPFVHWIVFDMEPETRSLPEGASGREGILEGKNSNLKRGWTGMAPPRGDTPHRYHFQLYALDRRLGLDDNVGRTELFDAMAGHVIARGLLVGTYARS
jgi:hypothetical protein